MRLIDADKFEGFIRKKYTDGEKAEDVKEQMLFDLSCQSTAYDPGKVVQRLVELRKAEQDRPDDCDEDGCGDGEQIYDDGRSQGRFEAFGKAINIVKGEYATEQSCEWNLEDVESNLYVTGCENRELIFEGTPEENGYKYCPYCGRKIKGGGKTPEKGGASKRGNPAG